MSAIPWIIISVGAVIILLAVIFIIFTTRKKVPRREPDYYAWFWIGICWVGAGIPLGINLNNWGIFGMGIIFLALGLVHKKDWKKNHVRWKDLTPLEKKFRYWILIVLGILVIAGAVAFFIFN